MHPNHGNDPDPTQSDDLDTDASDDGANGDDAIDNYDPSADDHVDQEVSKSQRKREAADITRLGQTLASLSSSELDTLGLDDSIRGHVEDLKKITSNGARKRQTLFLGKQLRAIDVEPILAGLETLRLSSHAETRLLHLAESWRDRLLARRPDGSALDTTASTGNKALTDFLSNHPHADRQLLRQLIRNANTEHTRQKPPKSARLLFQHLKDTLSDTPQDSSA